MWLRPIGLPVCVQWTIAQLFNSKTYTRHQWLREICCYLVCYNLTNQKSIHKTQPCNRLIRVSEWSFISSVHRNLGQFLKIVYVQRMFNKLTMQNIFSKWKYVHIHCLHKGSRMFGRQTLEWQACMWSPPNYFLKQSFKKKPISITFLAPHKVLLNSSPSAFHCHRQPSLQPQMWYAYRPDASQPNVHTPLSPLNQLSIQDGIIHLVKQCQAPSLRKNKRSAYYYEAATCQT